MRNLLIVFTLLGIFSCKKKEEEKKPDPAPVVTPAKTNAMTAKVNGSAWAVKGNQTADAKIDQGTGSGQPKQYVFYGMANVSMYKNAIWLWTAYATGTVNLRTSPGCSAIYFDSTGTAFYVKNGTMNITTMDTSHAKSSLCDKFKATFSFTTDSIGSMGYTIEQGSIDFEVH